MRRRALIASVGTAAGAVTVTAGCLDHRKDEDPDPTMQLGWLAANNFDAQPRRFDLQVERDGQEVHRSSHEVQASTEKVAYGTVAECTWGSPSGEYVVFARVDGGAWTEQSLASLADQRADGVDCGTVEARCRDGSVEILLRADCERVSSYDGGCAFANRMATEGIDD